ncbi:MAG: ATP-binding protein [Pseudomonadales bacterium]|nr:ATP-binding protein [Pseudomonadales bacterium]
MNSIFVRIYGGMIAASIVIGIVFYIVFQTTNYFRLQHFRSHLATGPLHLMVESIEARPAEKQLQWVKLLSRVFNATIELRDAASFNLSGKDLQRIEQGGMLLRHQDDEELGHVIIDVPSRKGEYLYAASDRITEEQAKGVAMLVVDKLTRSDIKRWSETIEDLNKRFSFPVKKLPPHQVELNSAQKLRLFNQHEAVAQFTNERGGNSSISAMVLIPQTGEILLVGPQELFNWYPLELLGFILIIAAALVGLAVYLLVKPLEQQLSRLEKAVLRIRGGDLDARAPVDGSHAIAQLAGTINGMADHIQRLIGSQKELTRAVSHELRTPVARIRFGLEMLADEDEEARRIRALEDIDEDIEQLDRLIDEILTYSKLEEGTPVLDFRMIDVNGLLEQIVRETNALGKGIQVEYSPPEVVTDKREAEGEERYVHRVVQNYVGNALRYAESRVRISYNVIGDIFRIDVEDDGPGISDEDRKRVFQPFTRLDDSRTRASGGYGLGLSIVARIAYWHGGKVKVGASDALGGAKFSFMWPRLQSMREST